MVKYFLIIFLFISVFTLTTLTTGIIYDKNNNKQTVTSSTVINREPQTKPLYRISVWDGKIAIFRYNSELPYKVYDTFINSLPESDAIKIISGINVNTSSELIKIIEDYTSWK